MNHELDTPQVCFNLSLAYEPQPVLLGYLLNWAKNLPQSDRGILDLAAGYGIEAKELIKNGFPCQAQDADQRMIDNALIQVFPGTVEDLSQYPPNSFGGALLKDTLIALSPQQRQKMLAGLQTILTPNGSLLVVSENLSKFYLRYSCPQVHNYTYTSPAVDTLGQMQQIRQQLLKEDATICLIAYSTVPEELKILAADLGFNFELINEYPANHPLALENRWHKTAGYIALLSHSS